VAIPGAEQREASISWTCQQLYPIWMDSVTGPRRACVSRLLLILRDIFCFGGCRRLWVLPLRLSARVYRNGSRTGMGLGTPNHAHPVTRAQPVSLRVASLPLGGLPRIGRTPGPQSCFSHSRRAPALTPPRQLSWYRRARGAGSTSVQVVTALGAGLQARAHCRLCLVRREPPEGTAQVLQGLEGGQP
jgi:hypothetical protein